MTKKEEKEVKNKTGVPEIDAALEALSKDFGDDMFGEDYGDLEFCTTGSTKLDCMLGRGGVPLGRIIEIIGDPGSMKTSILLAFMAQRQKWRRENNITNKRDVILDLEHMLEKSFIEGFGIDLSQVIWKRLDTAEEALNFLIDLLKTGAIDYVIVDSVDAMQNEKQIRRKIGENDVGGISKDMNTALRQITKLVANNNSTVFFVNQIKMNPGQMFGS